MWKLFEIMDAMQIAKKIGYVLGVFILIGGIFAGGVMFGYANRPSVEKVTSLFNKDSAMPAKVDFAPFWKTWELIDKKYVENNGEDNQKKVYGAIQGLVKSLGDPYSVFFTPEESKAFAEEMKGDFEGVGMEIGLKNDVIVVVAPLKGTPAERAGMKSGDKILKIDDKETTGLATDEAVRLIRGKKGTTVKILISRENGNGGEQKEISIVRDVIQIPVIQIDNLSSSDGAKIKDDANSQKSADKQSDVYVIRLYNFSAPSADAFRNSLRQFVESGKQKMIVDLRGNPGGYLEAAVDIASWFLPAGKIVARESFGNGDEHLYRSKGYDIFRNLPLAILIDKGSASASEILAGALREHGIAKLVGETSFGKGSVQELVPVTDNTSLKITIARWLTPNGKSISKEGIKPDIEVKFTKDDIAKNRDVQMDKAIELLKNWK